METAHRGEVGGQSFGVSLLQLLDEELDIGCDRFLRGLLLVWRGHCVGCGVLVAVPAAVVRGFDCSGLGPLLTSSWCCLRFEWLCCVCSQTRLGAGPRQQGRPVQEEGSLPATKRRASAAKVCTSAARKIRVPLVARQGRSSLRKVWLPGWARKCRNCF